MTNARYAYLRKTEFQKDRPRIDVTISFDTPTSKVVGFLFHHFVPPASGGLTETPQAF